MRRFLCTAFLLLAGLLAQAKSVDSLLLDINNAKTDSARLIAYEDIATHYQFSNTDSTLFYLKLGYSEFVKKNYKPGESELLSMMAAIDAVQGKMDVARTKQKEALALAMAAHNQNSIGTANNGLGVIEGRSGNYDVATQYFLTALRAYESINNKRGLINTYLKLGNINELTGNPERALEYEEQALKLCKPGTGNIPYLYNNMGIAYLHSNRRKEAIIYFQKSLEASSQPGFATIRVLPLNNLGDIYSEDKDTAKALSYYYQALEITDREKQLEDHTRLLVNIAPLIGGRDEHKAVLMLNEALDASKQLGQKILRSEILDVLIHIYRKQGNDKEAFRLFQQKKDVLDSVFNIEKAKQIANLQSVADLERSTRRIEKMEAERKKKAWQMKASLIALLSLLFICISQFYSYRKKQKLIRQLSLRELELKKSNTTKDRLLSIIGHDLRGPVASVPALLDIYLDEGTTESEKDYVLNSLRTNASASLETLDNLLGWGKHQIRGTSLDQKTFKVHDYLKNKLRLIQAAADLKGITVYNEVSPDVTVNAYIEHFNFIVRNLLSNAIKYTGNGGKVIISADTQKIDGFVVFAIKDNGIGINPQLQALIFSTDNMSTPGTANEKGTGIGLVLCKEFTEENGGKIWLESEQGAGTVFYFSLKKGVEKQV